MNLSRITSNSNTNTFSSQSIGQGFIKYIQNHEKESPDLENAIDFVTSNVFISSFGSSQLINLINFLISKYPSYSYSLERLIKCLLKSPLYFRISDIIEKLPEELIKKLEIDKNDHILHTFSVSELSLNNFTGENTISTLTNFDFKSPIVSLSDVFNEKAKDLMENPLNFSQFLEQFQPFSVSDVAEFISNLVNPNSKFYKNKDIPNPNEKTILLLLRPFKNQNKISADELIAAFDRENIFINSPATFQLLINCIKEVTNPRNVPVNPFFGRWQHPLTQLNFITYLVNSTPSSISFPKPAQIPRLNPVVIGDFKGEIWRCPEFIDTLAYLYDSSENGVDQILGNSLAGGPTLLLLVLALNPKVSRFATHLVRILLLSETQYMPGFAALWAANESFFIDLITTLYEEQHVLLGRFLDVIDDLAIFDAFLSKCNLKMAVLLYITAFFRRSYNFQDALLKLYETDKENTLNICFNIVENPVEYGFSIDHTERKISKDESVTADLIFFRFINEIYSSFDSSLKQRVNSLFDKCISRSSDLTRYTFLWRKKKEPPMSPKSPAPAKESDFIELATATDPRGISRYSIIVNSLLSSFPKDKTAAQSNGKTLGKLLARDLLSQQSTTQALKIIDQGIHSRENTPGLFFAIAALEELQDNFDLFLPFTKHLVAQKEFSKAAPSLHRAAVKACKPTEINIHQQPNQNQQLISKTKLFMKRQKFFGDNLEEKEIETLTLFEPRIEKLVIPACLERFKYVKISTDRMKHENISMKTKTNWDTLSLYYMKMATPTMQLNPEFVNNCIEAAIYLVYEYLNSPNCRSNKTICMLTRLGRWLGLNTLNKNKPIYSRLLDIPKLLLFGYTNSALCAVIPFVYAVFENASSIFKPPNSWTVSILSILGSFARIPYLNYSLYSLIIKFFSNFNVALNDIEPYPIRRLKIEYITTSDFFYPPLDFTSSLTMVSAEKLLNGDIVSLLHVVQEHFILSEEFEKIRSGIVREIGFFIYTKMSSIANTAAMTAFDLVLKDFARCQDPAVVDRHARALLHQYTNALSMMAVSLITDTLDPSLPNTIHRDAIHKNSRWIDQIVRQLSYSLGLQILLQRLQPIQKLRASWNNSNIEEQHEGNGSTCNISINANSISISPGPNASSSSFFFNTNKGNDGNDNSVGFGGYSGSSEYWDVKSFPPSIAQRIPPSLWPPNIQRSTSPYTRKVDSDSLVPTGLFECFNVNSDIRRAYSSLSLNPLPLFQPEIYPNELPFVPSLAKAIFDHFIIDSKTGQITSVKHPKQLPAINTFVPIPILATIIYCFPPNISRAASAFGAELVRTFFANLPNKEQLQPQIHRLLWNSMPDLTVFSQMVKENLIAFNFFEILTMHFIDQPISKDCDFSPLVQLSLDLLQKKQLYPHSIERLMSFLCTCANNTKNENNNKDNGKKNGKQNDNKNDSKDNKNNDNDNNGNKDENNIKGDDDNGDINSEKDNSDLIKNNLKIKNNIDNIDNKDDDNNYYNYSYNNYPYNSYNSKAPKNGKGLNISNSNDINNLTKTWHSYLTYDEHSHTISKIRHDQLHPLLANFDQQVKMGLQQVTDFIKSNQENLKNEKNWEELVSSSFPDRKTNLLRFFYASLNSCDHDPQIFLSFLRGTFSSISNKKISLDYFATILANVTLQLRSQYTSFFGGFLNDTRPIKNCSPYPISANIQTHYPFPYPYANPQLMGAWLYIFPLVIQPLLLDDSVFLPTSLLVVAMLNILARFPLNWGEYPEYRKCYKAILRIILLIIHDAPRFVRGYYFDFVSVIPLHFRKLRNVILTCGNTLQDQAQNFGNDRFILSKFAILKNDRLDRILSVGFIPNDGFNEIINDWVKSMFSLSEIGQFLIYSFKYLFYNDKPIDENTGKSLLWSMVKCILFSANTLRNAETVIECLFDMLRFDCKQTRFFNETLFLAFTKLDLNWDSVTVQDIIFTVLMQRSFGIQPIPQGVTALRDMLEPLDHFKNLLSIFRQNITNSQV